MSRDEISFRRIEEGQTRESRTDWVFCSHELTHETKYHWTQVSDHAVIESSLELPRSRPRATHIILPRADVILAMCKAAEENAKPFSEFFQEIARQVKTKKHLKKVRVTLKQKQEQKNTLEKFAELIDTLIRTTSSKQAFQLINRLSIIHPTRRDGGVMNCLMTGDDNRIIVGQLKVLLSCLYPVSYTHLTLPTTSRV